ncbi:MAG TPA: Uma2 family endonuclease [Longimicrobium sp.]|jgi:Uma2 family endonuclease
MATKPAFQHWTYAEFERLPDDGNRYEVIAGELVVSPSPRPKHQRALVRLTSALEDFTQEHGIGEVYIGPIDVIFGDGDYLEPDLAFVRRERAEIVSERGIEGAPDLVVEVISPSTALRDRGIKRERYALYGVPLYWVVDVDLRQMEVYRLAESPFEPVEIATDTLVLQPVEDGPSLTLSIRHIVGT